MTYLTAKDVEISFGGVKFDAASVTIEQATDAARKNLERAIGYVRGLIENPSPIRFDARWIVPPPSRMPCADPRGHRWRLNGSCRYVDPRLDEVVTFATPHRRVTLLRCTHCDARDER